MRPRDEIRGERSAKGYLSFSADQEIANGITFTISIDEHELEATPNRASFNIRGELHDYRVERLCSFIRGYDMTRICRLDFNILAAFNTMERRATPHLPMHDLDLTDEEIEAILRDYCAKVDRIWKFFGVRNATNVAAMSIWMLRHADAVGLIMDYVPKIFATFVYGERELALGFVSEYLEHWEEQGRNELDHPGVVSVLEMAREEVGRIRLIIT